MRVKIKKMKKKFHEIKPKDRQKLLEDFYFMVSKIRSKDDAKNFFKDLLTPTESIMIVYRIKIAKLLLAGFCYNDIQKKLKVGTNTINSVNKWLYNGFGGYMKEIKKADNQLKRRNVLPTNEWEKIKKKYPAHFLIFNLLDEYKK